MLFVIYSDLSLLRIIFCSVVLLMLMLEHTKNAHFIMNLSQFQNNQFTNVVKGYYTADECRI